jgi:Na+(H+)/acetate symporter ActP
MNVNRGEIARIMTPSLRKDGAVSPADRTYLVKLVSARTGLSQADAEQRVDQVTTQAKTAADQARKSAAKFSLWLAASMLAGALAAALAAVEGGNLRNREWYLGK